MSPTTKILYVITKSNFGGAQRYVYELALAMQARGYTVAVACGGRGELVTKLQAAGIQTFEIIGAQRDIAWQKELQALASLYRIVRDFRPDIIHLNSSKAGGLGSVIARLLRVPKIVFTAHGWPFLEPRSKAWRLMAFIGSYLTTLLSHAVITVSQYDAKHQAMPGTKHKVTVIHNALSEFPLLERSLARRELFDESFIQTHQHQIWVVTHGELNHNKNHTTAIDAIAEFNATNNTKLLYIIIGSGDTKSELVEQVSLRGVSDYVYFIEHVADVRQYLLAFDLYLMPSRKEGLPYALLEAGYAGLPVIASRVGGIPEVITDKETGLLINPDNHMNMVVALDYLLRSSRERFAYADELKQVIKQYYSPVALIEKTLRVYSTK